MLVILLVFASLFSERSTFTNMRLTKKWLISFIVGIPFSLLLFCNLYVHNSVKLPQVKSFMEQSGQPWANLYGKVNLTIRMAAKKELVEKFFCWLLRSAVLFWNHKYGDIVIILDEADISQRSYFPQNLSLQHLPFKYNFIYEKSPRNKEGFKQLGKRINKPYGYVLQLYSFFIMDQYFADDTIIALTDTDIVFTMPIVDESIVKDGKVVVKGMNSFHMGRGWVNDWQGETQRALGLPQVSDFMTYFPVYLYPRTIRNCRNYMLQRKHESDFEEVFLKFIRFPSPVNVVLSYAYYFERDSYYWHIDTDPVKPDVYNKDRLKNYPLRLIDLLPEPHMTLHADYSQWTIEPLGQAICYTKINIGIQNLTYCKTFIDKVNEYLYEFANHPNHRLRYSGWVNGIAGFMLKDIVGKRYSIIGQQYRRKLLELKTERIELVDKFTKLNYGKTCPPIKYQPFPNA